MLVCHVLHESGLLLLHMFSSVQISHVWHFVTPWTPAHQASLSITNSWGLLKLMPIESVIPSSHLILCHPLLPPPLIPPSIRVFSNESTLCMRWPKYWSFSFSISPSHEYPAVSESNCPICLLQLTFGSTNSSFRWLLGKWQFGLILFCLEGDVLGIPFKKPTFQISLDFSSFSHMFPDFD